MYQPLKRKSDAADHEAESSEGNTSAGFTEVVNSPLQTPGKGGKAPKTSRLSKSSKSGPQNATSNIGEHYIVNFLLSHICDSGVFYLAMVGSGRLTLE